MTSAPASPPDTAPAHAPEQRSSDKFVAYVLDLCQDKKTRAALRSGLGRPVERCNYLHRHLVRRLPQQQHPDTRRAHYAVAALIAGRPPAARNADTTTSPDDKPTADWFGRPNLGASLAQAVNTKLLKPDSAEADLHLMARQSSNAIHPRLPSLTQHLLKGGVVIDWAVLLEDLSWWNRNHDKIATRWLESYFRVRTLEDKTTDAPEENA